MIFTSIVPAWLTPELLDGTTIRSPTALQHRGRISVFQTTINPSLKTCPSSWNPSFALLHHSTSVALSDNLESAFSQCLHLIHPLREPFTFYGHCFLNTLPTKSSCSPGLWLWYRISSSTWLVSFTPKWSSCLLSVQGHHQAVSFATIRASMLNGKPDKELPCLKGLISSPIRSGCLE